MITTDFVNVNGIEWGKYPYYYGDTYSIGNVYFATFGCKKAIQYKDFVDGDKTIPISEKTDYLSMYNNGGLKEYYGENIFQQKNSLASRDDFIRTEKTFCAIPTEEELKKLIDWSDIYCSNGKLIIQPYEMNDGVKNYKGEISIPFLGLVDYIADNTVTTTKYDVKNGSIKYVGIGTWIEIAPHNWDGKAPDKYPFVVIQKDGGGHITSYKCYEDGYYYSDIFLLTSSIPKDEYGKILTSADEAGQTFAHVLHIYIKANILDDNENTPDISNDVEFLSFEVDIDSEGKRRIIFENIRCCEGENNSYKDRGFIVLPIKYEGVVNVNITGNLLLNGKTFLGYDQDANKDVVPYLKINPFGIPKITNSEYNYTFSNSISNGQSELQTYFNLPNGTTSSLDHIIKITDIDGDEAKITNTTEEDGNYWILSNNECLYSYSDGTFKYIVFDDRSFFSSDEKTTTINIIINTIYKDKYTVGDNRFVLPSIYKPFYIKTLIGVEVFHEDYVETFVTTTHTNVYNGIGLFAYRGIGHVPDSSGGTSGGTYISTVLDEDYNNILNPSLPLNPSQEMTPSYHLSGSSPGETTFPDNLKERLNLYFDGDTRFSEEFEDFFYDPYVDAYAIGLISSNVKISKSDNTFEYDCSNYPLPIFRQKPLILTNYSDSVFDFVDIVEVDNLSNDYKKNTRLEINKKFYSVIEPYKRIKFNIEREYSTNIDFGELFGKIKGSLTDTGNTYANDINNIIKEGRKVGIRYYMVNNAFYDNYVNNYCHGESGFIKYKEEYYNNREYYDLNPHKVDFKRTSMWDNMMSCYDDYEERYYIPFFDMIPALKNTVGYLYSDVKYNNYGGDIEKIKEDEPNFNAPMAAEIYYYENIVSGGKNTGVTIERQCIKINGNNNTCDSIDEYSKYTYLIGAYTPLTRLNGGCTTDDFEFNEYNNDYVNHIKNGNVILPQKDEVSIIFCYGLINY